MDWCGGNGSILDAKITSLGDNEDDYLLIGDSHWCYSPELKTDFDFSDSNATGKDIIGIGDMLMGVGEAYGNYYYDNLFCESDNDFNWLLELSDCFEERKIVNNEVYNFKGNSILKKASKNSSVELKVLLLMIYYSQEER
ncbi:hypothetical protein FQA39_LY18622 [Lamprigera yunnana]|nr:hypothetical protein FQA39_LY18622 [Lamprigera yunnana]